jgi:hypothetical protein
MNVFNAIHQLFDSVPADIKSKLSIQILDWLAKSGWDKLTKREKGQAESAMAKLVTLANWDDVKEFDPRYRRITRAAGPAKKAPAKRAPAKKAPAKKFAARKAAAKKAARRR